MNFKEMVISKQQHFILKEGLVYCVDEGIIQLWELHADGTEILLTILAEGDAWKIQSHAHYVYELRTSNTFANLFVYDWPSVQQIEQKYFLLQKIYATYMRTEKFNRIKRMKFVKDRLHAVLSLLAEEYGQYAHDTSYQISFTLTHEQLACLILSTRTTVTKLLNEVIVTSKITS